jgi:hypothetical protein
MQSHCQVRFPESADYSSITDEVVSGEEGAISTNTALLIGGVIGIVAIAAFWWSRKK